MCEPLEASLALDRPLTLLNDLQVGNNLIVDPTSLEEQCAASVMHIAVSTPLAQSHYKLKLQIQKAQRTPLKAMKG